MSFFGAFFFAPDAVPTLFAGVRAVRAFPASGADASSVFRYAGAVIHAVALGVTISSVKSLWALRLATNPYFTLRSGPSRKLA